MSAPTTAQLARQWRGPALFSYGFRPFFSFGALYAAIAVAVWVPWFLGFIELPTDFPPIAWHVHELLFGYVPAIVAGFLLTAVPNWTGRLPVVGWPLAALFGIWLAGRVAVATSLWIGPVVTAAVALSFLVALCAVIGREILAGRNRRNFKVLVIVLALLGSQALFQWEVFHQGYSDYGARLAIAVVIMLITVIGGRIVPSFTGNWLRQRGSQKMPRPFSRYDVVAIVVSVAALAAWTLEPALGGYLPWVAALLLIAAAFQLVRLARWQPQLTFAEPLVMILHAGYLFIPLGFVLAALAVFHDDGSLATGAVHAWTTGAIGTMTLAVMTRATLGHTGRGLSAGPATIVIYLSVLIAAFSRLGAALSSGSPELLLAISATAWVVAFGGFVLAYGPLLIGRRRDAVAS
jgi:uncharacterized protein involved in response to NO